MCVRVQLVPFCHCPLWSPAPISSRACRGISPLDLWTSHFAKCFALVRDLYSEFDVLLRDIIHGNSAGCICKRDRKGGKGMKRHCLPTFSCVRAPSSGSHSSPTCSPHRCAPHPRYPAQRRVHSAHLGSALTLRLQEDRRDDAEHCEHNDGHLGRLTTQHTSLPRLIDEVEDHEEVVHPIHHLSPFQNPLAHHNITFEAKNTSENKPTALLQRRRTCSRGPITCEGDLVERPEGAIRRAVVLPNPDAVFR